MNLTYTTPAISLAWSLNNSKLTKGTVYADILSEPKLFTAAENISNYIFNMTLDSSPATTSVTFTVFGLPSTSAGSIFLKNDLVTISLTASNTPSTNQFYNSGAGVTPADRTARAESIVYELRNNLSFSQYYNIYNQGATIYIVARIAGAKYNFDWSALTTNLTALGGISYVKVDGSDEFLYQNLIDYSTFVEVYAAEGVYGNTINRRNAYLADTYSIPPFAQANFAINVSDSIKHFVDVVLPTKRTTPVISLKELDKQIDVNGNPILPVVRPYFITWGYEQRFAAGLEKKKFLTGQSRISWVLNGAFGLLEDYDFTPYILDTTASTPVKFMTSSPRVKDTDYDSQEYIHFYRKFNTFELGNFGLEVTYTFNDLTSVTQSYPFLAHSTINGTISIDVSPNVLQIQNIELLNGKEVLEYNVKLYWTISSSARLYSEDRTYRMKRICNKLTNNVIFLNEFGVWDTINFTGEVEKNVEREVEYLQRPIGINTPNTGFETASDEIQIPVNMNVRDTYTITSELMDKDNYNHLSRILNSSAVFIYSPADNRYKAIKIENYDYLYNTLNDQSTFVMTYSFTVNNNYITR